MLDGVTFDAITVDDFTASPSEVFAGSLPTGQNVYAGSALKVGAFNDAGIDSLAKARVLEVFNGSPLFAFAHSGGFVRGAGDSGFCPPWS